MSCSLKFSWVGNEARIDLKRMHSALRTFGLAGFRRLEAHADAIARRVFQIRMRDDRVTARGPRPSREETPLRLALLQRSSSPQSATVRSAHGDEPFGGRADGIIQLDNQWRSSAWRR